MASHAHPAVTVAEYLSRERQSEQKSEFLEGEVVAMGGASRKHNLIAGNIFAAWHAQLKGRDCEIYKGDMRVRIPSSDFYAYPDVVVVCGRPRFEDDNFDTLTNPALIVEVLSKSTEAFDRGGKFARYRTIPSLKDYVLVSQEAVCLEHFSRQESGRRLLSASAGLENVLEFGSIQCRLALREVYDRAAELLD